MTATAFMTTALGYVDKYGQELSIKSLLFPLRAKRQIDETIINSLTP
jgi:hypothetical protein